MRNLGTAKLEEYKLPNKLCFLAIKQYFSNYIFAKKKEDGKYYILADKEQVKMIKNKLGITIKPTKTKDHTWEK